MNITPFAEIVPEYYFFLIKNTKNSFDKHLLFVDKQQSFQDKKSFRKQI
jgi:hypothetical protein